MKKSVRKKAVKISKSHLLLTPRFLFPIVIFIFLLLGGSALFIQSQSKKPVDQVLDTPLSPSPTLPEVVEPTTENTPSAQTAPVTTSAPTTGQGSLTVVIRYDKDRSQIINRDDFVVNVFTHDKSYSETYSGNGNKTLTNLKQGDYIVHVDSPDDLWGESVEFSGQPNREKLDPSQPNYNIILPFWDCKGLLKVDPNTNPVMYCGIHSD